MPVPLPDAVIPRHLDIDSHVTARPCFQLLRRTLSGARGQPNKPLVVEEDGDFAACIEEFLPSRPGKQIQPVGARCHFI